MKGDEFQVFDSQHFRSARGNKSLIELARLQVSHHGERFVVRMTIELRCFAMIEVWSRADLGWEEIHTIPGPLVPETIEESLEQVTRLATEIMKG